MISTKYHLALSLTLTSILLLGCNKNAEDHDDHANHEEVAHDTLTEQVQNEHASELSIELSPKEAEKAGLQFVQVTTGLIPGTRRLYGEIRLNEDQVIHKYPKYPGIVRDVRGSIGDKVFKGDTLALIFNTNTLSIYPVIAAQSGEVLEKHAVVGEFTDGSEPLMIVGDLRTVWVDLHAFEKDLPLLKPGQGLTLKSIEGDEQIITTIRYIKPVMDSITRTNIVRCIVRNTSGTWNPGRLVYAEATYDHDGDEVLIVPENCIQTYESEYVVFVPESEGEFEVVTVEVGQRGGGLIEIKSGLKLGDRIVSNGSFFLKSELVTSSLSGHAGHGH